MDAELLERFLALHRVAQEVSVGERLVSELVAELDLVRSRVTAREQNRGAALEDAKGDRWEPRLARLLAEAKRARRAAAIRAVCQRVVREIEPIRQWSAMCA